MRNSEFNQVFTHAIIYSLQNRIGRYGKFVVNNYWSIDYTDLISILIFSNLMKLKDLCERSNKDEKLLSKFLELAFVNKC